jgi:hypothetical protein
MCNGPSIPVLLNRRAAACYQALASIIPGSRLIEEIVYWAAVSQKLRNTGLYDCDGLSMQPEWERQRKYKEY